MFEQQIFSRVSRSVMTSIAFIPLLKTIAYPFAY
jgi:hypothetical protein